MPAPRNRLEKILERVQTPGHHAGEEFLVTIADVHLCNDSSYGRMEEGVNTDLKEKVQVFVEAADVARALECPLVVAGDLIDQRVVDAVTLEQAAMCFASYDNILLLGGNHEFDDSAARFSTLKQYEILSEGGLKRVILENENFEWPSRYGTYSFCCVPANQRIEDRLCEALDGWGTGRGASKHHKILVFHGPILGADLGHIKSQGGVSEKLVDRAAKAFDWMVCGDFHKHQFVRDNVYYCGSPKQMNVGDAGDPRGYQVVNLTQRKVHHIRSAAPRFLVLEAVVGGKLDRRLTKPTAEKVGGRIVVVQVTGTSKQLSEFGYDEVREKLLAAGAHSVYKDSRPLGETRNSVVLDPKLSRKEMVASYVQQRDHEQTDAVRKRHLSVLTKYAEAV